MLVLDIPVGVSSKQNSVRVRVCVCESSPRLRVDENCTHIHILYVKLCLLLQLMDNLLMEFFELLTKMKIKKFTSYLSFKQNF